MEFNSSLRSCKCYLQVCAGDFNESCSVLRDFYFGILHDNQMHVHCTLAPFNIYGMALFMRIYQLALHMVCFLNNVS